ncbi:MAG: AAA family ATPase [Acidimicrobiia bacterium]
MTLFGREDLVESLVNGQEYGLVLLVGDSGTGKSALLAEVQERSANTVSSAPVRANHAPGSLQLALLESLGSVVAALASDEPTATRVGRRIVEAAKRVKDSRLADIRSAVGRHLLGLVKARLGEDLGMLIGEFARSISESENVSLQSRITAASDHDVIEQILSLIDEVKEMATPLDVALAIDDLDRLNDEDLQRLADIIARLPSGVSIRGSFTTWHAASRQRAELLIMNGARDVPVGGLEPAAVSEWLLASELDESLTATVVAATNGYPVHIQDAIGLLQATSDPEVLEALSPDAITRARVTQAWRELDTPSQIVAAKLAIFVDPISIDRVCALLGLNEIAWHVVRRRLTDSGLMIPDSTGWFHELRRRAIWAHVLDDDLRAVSAVTATAELQARIDGPSPTPSDFADYARVAAFNPSLQESAEGLSAAISMSSDEVAIAAAALELIETKHGERAILADMLLLHARDVFRLRDGGVDALGRLVDAGLMYVQATAEAAAAVPTWRSLETIQVVIGRAAAELGRMPIAQIASQVFAGVVHSRLGAFDMARFGVGRLTLAEGSRQVVDFHQREREGTRRVGFPPTGLFVRGSYANVPIHACVSFDSPDDRDAAATKLSGLKVELWNESFTVHDVVRLPFSVVPSLRFARAVAWLDGRDFSTTSLRPAEAHRDLSVTEDLYFRHQIRNWIRGRLSSDELLAYDLDLPTGYAYWTENDIKIVIEILGADSVLRLDQPTGVLPPGPYTRLQLAEQLGLPAGQSVGTIGWYHGSTRREDPVTSEVVDLQKRVAACNRNQARREILLEESSLARMIHESFDLRMSDARSLVAAVPDAGLSEPTPLESFVVLVVNPPMPGFVDGAHSIVHRVAIPSRTGEHGIHFRIEQRTEGDRRDTREIVGAAFGVDLSDPLTHGWAGALRFLPTLLGFSHDEVRFQHPDTVKALTQGP